MLKTALKRLAARLMRPGLLELEARAARIEAAVAALAGNGPNKKYESELSFWRTLIKHGGDIHHFGEPFEQLFARWQRARIEELGDALGLPAHTQQEGGANGQTVAVAEIDRWCHERSVVEIGAGPYPSIAAARLGWKRAVAVDPIAKGYCEEGLLPAACDRLVYIEAAGEKVPLPAGFADLVIIENCLDHVADPKAVIAEIERLLIPGGLVWLFVDLSEYADQMHPHPMSESRVLALMGRFELIRGGRATNKAHPEAYGAYRGLWRKPGGTVVANAEMTVRVGQAAAVVNS
jgi:SAM-dependent methyltransferase